MINFAPNFDLGRRRAGPYPVCRDHKLTYRAAGISVLAQLVGNRSTLAFLALQVLSEMPTELEGWVVVCSSVGGVVHQASRSGRIPVGLVGTTVLIQVEVEVGQTLRAESSLLSGRAANSVAVLVSLASRGLGSIHTTGAVEEFSEVAASAVGEVLSAGGPALQTLPLVHFGAVVSSVDAHLLGFIPDLVVCAAVVVGEIVGVCTGQALDVFALNSEIVYLGAVGGERGNGETQLIDVVVVLVEGTAVGLGVGLDQVEILLAGFASSCIRKPNAIGHDHSCAAVGSVEVSPLSTAFEHIGAQIITRVANAAGSCVCVDATLGNSGRIDCAGSGGWVVVISSGTADLSRSSSQDASSVALQTRASFSESLAVGHQGRQDAFTVDVKEVLRRT